MKQNIQSFASSYRLVSVSGAVLCSALAISLLLIPDLIYWIFGFTGNDVADLMSKRAAALFLGLAIIAFKSRNEPNSSLRQSIAFGFATMMLGLACLGIFEFTRGQAGLGIWLAIIVELAFAVLYFRFWKITKFEDSK